MAAPIQREGTGSRFREGLQQAAGRDEQITPSLGTWCFWGYYLVMLWPCGFSVALYIRRS